MIESNLRKYLANKSWVYHKTDFNKKLSDAELEYHKKIFSLNDFYYSSMDIMYGRKSSLKVNQMYLETLISFEYTAFSFPSVLESGTNLNNRILSDPPDGPYISKQF